MTLFYVCYHIPTRTVHYRQAQYASKAEALLELDRWNAAGRGVWQYYSVVPGYSCPADTSEYTC